MPLPLRYRPLGEGAVLFNEHTWRTHVLTPAAALIYTALLETSNGEAVAKNTALQVLEQELDVNPEAPEIRRLLKMLEHLGVVV